VSRPELWLDSNVARSPHKVRQLANLARTKGIAVLAHAQVHLELCRQIRLRAGAAFDPRVIDSLLATLGIVIAEAKLDRAIAESWAEQLHARYPTDGDWKRAKLSSVRSRLPDEATITADRVPFTTDWLVALEVERREAFITVEDRGEEWRALREASPKRALSFDEAMAWLAARETVGAPPG
jgi:hypothetical protein